MTFANNYNSRSSRYASNYTPHRPQSPPATFSRKRPYTPPRPQSPAYPYLGPSRRRELDSPHSSSQSSYAPPSRRPQKRHRRAPLSTAPKDYDAKSVSQSTVVHCASFSQGAHGCISTAFERKLGVAQEGVAHIWDARGNPPSLRLRSTLHHQSRVFRAALSSDAMTAVTTSQDGFARVWSAAGMDYTSKTLSYYQPFRNARACAISPEANYAAVSFYSGCKKPTFEGDCISSFKSQVFVTQIQTSSNVFAQVEKGIADQIVLATNASVIAIGLCCVSPAPKLARRHRILVYNKRGKELLSLPDCFPPEQHGCTAWHMSATGERLAVCSKGNDLQVYYGNNRREWALTPTSLSSQSFHGFSQCRFSHNHDILAAVGISGKHGESVLGLFRVSDAIALLVIPIQVHIANVLDIHPHPSASNAMDTTKTHHSVSVVTAVSGKASRAGSLLKLQVYGDSREKMRAQRFSQQESKRKRTEQDAPEKMAVDNSRSSHVAKTGFVPFRLCRDPSPFRQVNLESPSASRSSAAMKSSESSVQTPLHNRFASWPFEKTAQQTLKPCEAESQNSRRDERRQCLLEEASTVLDPGEDAVKSRDPSPQEKGSRQAESCIKPNADTSRILENHKNIQESDVGVHTSIRESSTKSRGIVNSKESLSSIEAGSLSHQKSHEAQLESRSEVKESATPSKAQKPENSTPSGEIDQKVVQEKKTVINGKDKKASSRFEIEDDKNLDEKEPFHTEGASSINNTKAFEPLDVTTDKNGGTTNQLDGSRSFQDREEVLARQSAGQKELPETNSKKNCMSSCPQKPRVLVPESGPEQDNGCENKEVSLNISVNKKDLSRGVKKDNAAAVLDKNAKKIVQADKGSEKMQDTKNLVKEAYEKEKVETQSAISTPQSDDWTPATRFAVREQSRMRDAENPAKPVEKEIPAPHILEQGVTASKHKQSLLSVHQFLENVESQDAKLIPQNNVRTESLSDGTRNSNRTPFNQERSNRNLLITTNSTKSEVQPIMVNRPITTQTKGGEKEGEYATENSKGECGSADLVQAPNLGAQEAEAQVSLTEGEHQKAKKIPKKDRDLSTPREIPLQSTGVVDKPFHKTSLGSDDKKTQPWLTVHARLGHDQKEMNMAQDEIDEQDTHIRIPSRYLELCRKVFSEACRAFRVTDMNTLTNQDAYTTMLGFTEKELGYVEKKSVAKIIYDIVGIQNACSLEMFIDAFRLILDIVKASRREQWTDVFSRATCKAGESILVFHARDLLKGERDRGNIDLAQKWTDPELEALFERISSGMLVDLTSFLHCVDEILESQDVRGNDIQQTGDVR